jgi:TPR repeat protein
MRRWAITAALPLAMGLALPAWAGDAEDCNNSNALLKTQPVRAVAACSHLAEKGVASAQFKLGEMYAKGDGLPEDDAEAMKWWQKAADQGNVDAQHNLAVSYFSGEDVPQDYVQAYLWWNLAAATGDADAAKDRDNVATKMTPAQIEQAKALVAAWKPKTTP